MTVTYTSNLKLGLPTTGTESGTWGDVVNQQITTPLDQSVSGTVSLTSMTDADYTLTNGNGNAANEARYMAVLVPSSLTLTAARNIIVPTTSKMYIVQNSTTGGFAVTVKTSGGSGISVPNGSKGFVYCDGTNVVDAFSNFGGAATGQTAAATDNSTKLATTAFMRSVGMAASSVTGLTTNTTLTNSNYGQFLYVSGTMTLTLPVADSTNINRMITAYCYTTGAITVATQSTQTMYYQGTSTTTTAPLMVKGDIVTFINYNGSAWMAMAVNPIGVSQTWAASANTTAGTTYTNTTGKPIVFQVSGDLSTSYSYIYITVNGVNIRGTATASGVAGSVAAAIIPPNTSYSFNVSAGSLSSISAFALS